MRLRQAFASRKARAAMAALILLCGAAAADWRDWISWPDFVTYEGRRYGDYLVTGKAPWCFMWSSTGKLVECDYLSETQCTHANYRLVDASMEWDPDERGICVPNPIDQPPP